MAYRHRRIHRHPPLDKDHESAMLRHLLIAALLLLPLSTHAAEPAKNMTSGDLNWSVQATWTLTAKPLDLAHSLDNKKVFILADDAKVHIFTAEGKKLGEMPVAADINGIDIAPRGEMLYLINGKDKSFTALNVSFTQKIDVTGAPVLGRQDAPVTLVVFSDFECPHCGKIKPVLDQLLTANKDALRIVFKHLPLRMHEQAEPAALAAISAQKQGKFWQMHDALFQVKEWKPTVIDETAKAVGLDMTKYAADKNSQETRMQLAKDMNDAQSADISATPSLFINGRPVKERSLPYMQAMVDEAKADAGTK